MGLPVQVRCRFPPAVWTIAERGSTGRGHATKSLNMCNIRHCAGFGDH